jgi:hypothetical protein
MIAILIISIPFDIIAIAILYHMMNHSLCKRGIHSWKDVISTISEGKHCHTCAGKGEIVELRGYSTDGLGLRLPEHNRYRCNDCGCSGWTVKPKRVISGYECKRCKKFKKFGSEEKE